MADDPIVAEVRKARATYAAKCGNTLSIKWITQGVRNHNQFSTWSNGSLHCFQSYVMSIHIHINKSWNHPKLKRWINCSRECAGWCYEFIARFKGPAFKKGE
jgi:hypothetical protein